MSHIPRWAVSLAVATLTANVLAQTATPSAAGTSPIELTIDATDLQHKVLRVQETLPVKPGALTLHFPKWLPGTHGPFGAIAELAGLKIHAQGQSQALPWRRDPLDPYAFEVTVPAGVERLTLQFEHLSPVTPDSGRVVMTPEMLNVEWINAVLYPKGSAPAALPVKARLRLPDGWQQGSALRVEQETANAQGHWVNYKTVSLETLVDSPVYAGRHFKRIELDPAGTARPVVLNIVADNPKDLEASDVQIQAHRNLVVQATRLFGARHFAHYDFLLSLSKNMGFEGLEHHESSENSVGTDYFKDWAKKEGPRGLLPHEFTHSWNGKYRRPADLLTPHFNTPMQNSLLWVYEGQTQFWGYVLTSRSGLVTPEQARDDLAKTAARIDAQAGRVWRNLQDTTNEATMGQHRNNKDWPGYQRGADYYDESLLIWLEADGLIREKSGGKKCMDDFAHAFFGGDTQFDGSRIVPKPYDFDEVVRTLNSVVAHDWRQFLRSRLDSHGPGGPLGGLERAGWKLVFTDKPSEFEDGEGRRGKQDDFSYSLGFSVREGGDLGRVAWGGPAFDAGLSEASQLVAVNGRSYSAERLKDAIQANTGGQAPLELLVKEGDRYRTARIDYRGGLRYPHLERLDKRPDTLSSLLSAR